MFDKIDTERQRLLDRLETELVRRGARYERFSDSIGSPDFHAYLLDYRVALAIVKHADIGRDALRKHLTSLHEASIRDGGLTVVCVNAWDKAPALRLVYSLFGDDNSINVWGF